MQGKLIIISAPSGAGKTTIVKDLLSRGLKLSFSISATSRPPRGNEQDGKDYYFMSSTDFKAKIDNREFVEWEEVYPGRYYGTLEAEIKRVHEEGKHVLLDIDVAGGVKVKSRYGALALSIFIKPPSVEVLRERLIKRGTDSLPEIENRVAKAEKELSFAHLFDQIIVNDNLNDACEQTFLNVKRFIN